MTDPDLTIISDETPSQKNNFPIVAQLAVLSLIMFALLGSFLLNNQELPEAPPKPITKTETPDYPVVPQKIESIAIKARSAYVWDVASQRALYTKNPDESLPLASITKLMTSLLAYELLDESSVTDVPLSAIQQEGSSGLLAGEAFSHNQLGTLALISSSNDAAYALAANVGSLLGDNDPADQFVTGMNIRAGELGLDSLSFMNTTGLDLSSTAPGAIGNARDVSFLMEYIVTNYPELLSPTKEASARVYNTEGLYHDVNNTNPVVQQIPNLIGSKTGYTDLAGGNLTIAFDVGLNRPIIITVLGSTQQERFTDVLTLVQAVQDSIANQ